MEQIIKVSLKKMLQKLKSVKIVYILAKQSSFMLSPNLPEPDLLRQVLQPLLEDFQYWFERSHRLLQTEDISFLSHSQQSDLLSRIEVAQQEVKTAKIMFDATDGKVGVEMGVLMVWHQLLTQCWQISTRFRVEKSQNTDNPKI